MARQEAHSHNHDAARRGEANAVLNNLQDGLLESLRGMQRQHIGQRGQSHTQYWERLPTLENLALQGLGLLAERGCQLLQINILMTKREIQRRNRSEELASQRPCQSNLRIPSEERGGLREQCLLDEHCKLHSAGVRRRPNSVNKIGGQLSNVDHGGCGI